MTLIPYPNNPARLDAANPIFNDNSFVRGDEQRLNNSEIWANFTNLDTNVETLYNTYLYKGLINGSLIRNTLALPPTLTKGVYEVNGKLIYKTSDTVLTWADVFYNSRQAIETAGNYMVFMDDSGSVKVMLVGEGIAQASQSVTNSTGTILKTLTVPTVPGVAAEVYTAVISGSGSYTGIFKAVRASATTFTINLTSDPGNTFTGMTVVLYFQISTLHPFIAFPYPATLQRVTDGSTCLKYSPSLGENGETDSLGLFDNTRNGFYCTLPGLTNWRILGTLNVQGSNLMPEAIFSFRSGRDKNDNFLSATTLNSLVTNATRWTNLTYAFGCDYIWYSSNATFGSAVLFSRGGRVNSRFQGYSSAGASTISLWGGDIGSISTNTIASATMDTGLTVSTFQGGLTQSFRVNKDYFVKPLATAATTGDTRVRFSMDFTLD